MSSGKGKISPPEKLTGSCARVVGLGCEKEELSREWPPAFAWVCREIVA
jgi:hypothetical protein